MKRVLKKINSSLTMPLDDFLGLKIFGLPQYFSYVLFSRLFSLIFLRNKGLNPFLSAFHEIGFAKGDSLPPLAIDSLVEILEKQDASNDGSHSYKYIIDPEAKKIIIKLIKENMQRNITDLENYFHSNIYLTNVQVSKNFPISNFIEEEEFYSENFHCDHYLSTYFKAQILLEDVALFQGPLNCFSKKDSLRIMKAVNWKDRFNRGEIKDIPYKNTGEKGNVLFFRPTECLHKAGIPENNETRTLITLIFQAIPNLSEEYNPFYLEYSEKDLSIWENENDLLSKKFAKPAKISQLVSYFFSFIKKKTI